MKNFSIAAVPLFPGLRRFPQGRGFKQWTGDDSKALMKVCTQSSLVLVFKSIIRSIYPLSLATSPH